MSNFKIRYVVACTRTRRCVEILFDDGSSRSYLCDEAAKIWSENDGLIGLDELDLDDLVSSTEFAVRR